MSLELGGGVDERLARTVGLGLRARRWVRSARVPAEGSDSTRARPVASPGDAGCAAQDPLAHQPSCSTARWSARTTSAAEVAPGSWWPIERSPR